MIKKGAAQKDAGAVVWMCTGLPRFAGLEDLNMSSMPADLAAAERDGAWDAGRGADRAGAAGLAAWPEA